MLYNLLLYKCPGHIYVTHSYLGMSCHVQRTEGGAGGIYAHMRVYVGRQIPGLGQSTLYCVCRLLHWFDIAWVGWMLYCCVLCAPPNRIIKLRISPASWGFVDGGRLTEPETW